MNDDGGTHVRCLPATGRGGAGAAVRLVGQVDVRTVGTLRSLLHAAIDGGTGPLRVDVAGLELGDHAALAVLFGGTRRARAAGRTMVFVDEPRALGRMCAADRRGRLRSGREGPDLAAVGQV
ncbi:STAS domain-containing protein [Frankia sp. AgB32]|uniref:STAS domain-containing protein n=1 Tax=Frankia sp. AgB32 TaxID=631119 RepID=UPI00200FA80A|nr:STAS domain-containing protein [Frankia sp. AgB32]MCK9896128.1 STAS domain-containing protein [Frankia sp. AgB32]